MSITGAIGARARPLGLDEDDLRLLAAGIDVRQALVDLKFTKSLYFMNQRRFVTRSFKSLTYATYTGGAGFLTNTDLAGNVTGPYAANTLGETDAGAGIWEARTNLVRASSDVSNSSYWARNLAPTVTTNYAVGPDGTQTAVRIQASAPQSGVLQAINHTSGVTYCMSWLVRDNGGPDKSVLFGVGTTAFASGSGDRRFSVNTSTWEVTAVNAVYSAVGTVALVGGWRLVWAVYTATATASAYIMIYGASSDSDLVCAGAQLEAGAFVTRYIPTTTAAATRTALNASITGLGSILTPPFTAFVEAYLPAVDGVVRTLLDIDDGTGLNRFRLVRGASNSAVVQSFYGGSLQSTIYSAGSFTGANIIRAALNVNADGATASVNGVLGTKAYFTPPTVSKLLPGNKTDTTEHLNGQIRRILILPDMSNAALAALTA